MYFIELLTLNSTKTGKFMRFETKKYLPNDPLKTSRILYVTVSVKTLIELSLFFCDTYIYQSAFYPFSEQKNN